ncbi:hypothetical protein [Moraxella sp. ZY210820]|nr:hypothetical protein [Moraxella sp. ZY210820]WLF82867.1 hypothetical protein LU301_06125 [Moraxella sp. ZY210820]
MKTIELNQREIEFLKSILNEEINKFDVKNSDDEAEYRYDTACDILGMLE